MHTHALDCVIDPAMPAAVRPVRWPELRANPLHTGRTATHGNERRLLAAATAQEIDMARIDESTNPFAYLTSGDVWGRKPEDMKSASPDSALAACGSESSRCCACRCQRAATCEASTAPDSCSSATSSNSAQAQASAL